jgi:hypothetical protein
MSTLEEVAIVFGGPALIGLFLGLLFKFISSLIGNAGKNNSSSSNSYSSSSVSSQTTTKTSPTKPSSPDWPSNRRGIEISGSKVTRNDGFVTSPVGKVETDFYGRENISLSNGTGGRSLSGTIHRDLSGNPTKITDRSTGQTVATTKYDWTTGKTNFIDSKGNKIGEAKKK